MARKKTPAIRVNVKAQVSARLRELRQELFGEHGGPDLARRLNLPARTWYNYETGVTVPAEVLLAFISETGANPKWLLTGEGPRFRHDSQEISLDDLSPSDLIRRSLAQLSKEERQGASVKDYVTIDVVPLSSLDAAEIDVGTASGNVIVDRSWIPNPESTLASVIEDDSMAQVLPEGSYVAVDLSARDPIQLAGRIAVAKSGNRVLIRWVERSDRHIILRSNRPEKFPLLPLDLDENGPDSLIGQVVWSWTRFAEE